MYPSIRWSIGVAVIALVGATPGARAQSTSRLYDKWQIDLSGSVLVMGTDIRVDGANGEGTEIDGEEVLGGRDAGMRSNSATNLPIGPARRRSNATSSWLIPRTQPEST